MAWSMKPFPMPPMMPGHSVGGPPMSSPQPQRFTAAVAKAVGVHHMPLGHRNTFGFSAAPTDVENPAEDMGEGPMVEKQGG